MNNHRTTCDPERIELFLQRKLSDEEQTAFESHLSDCDDCCRRLESTAASEDIWSGIRDSLRDQQLPPDWLRSDDSALDSATGEEHSSSQATVLKLLAPTDDDRMIGRWGTYEVVGVIGSGGMGVVLKAFDAALNRYVAIKILAPHLGNSGGARKRFSREAQAAAAVVHDNVMEIYGVAETAGLPYLVMPYLRGPSLQRRLDGEGPLALVEILRVGMQAAAGLAAAHAQGLVHRDVKPANILLPDGIERVKLTDFGLARAADDASLTKTGIIAGTPQYMSPEQARGEAVDQRSDLFSLGSVLYAMCTGRPPFRAETSYGVLRRITDEEPRPIREINPEIPQWLCEIVAKLMAKRPDDRFQSAREVAGLLEECLAHVQQPTVVPLPACSPLPPGEGQGVRAAARSLRLRNPFFTGALAMIATLTIGLLAMFAMQSTSPPDIAGKWQGEGWGQVVITQTAPGEYTGTYTDTVAKEKELGKINLKWSRIERRFNGTWSEGEDRFGDLSIRLADQEIRGALTTDPKSKVNPATPRLADLTWTRSLASPNVELPSEKSKVTLPPYRIEPPDVLQIELLKPVSGAASLTGHYLVGPDGTINLRRYGVVQIAGKTVIEARTALQKHLAQYFESPEISVDVAAYNSKVYYVITQGASLGDTVRRLPITGNETVLDAVSQVGGLSNVSSKKMWISRPAANDFGKQKVLPIDWDGVAQGADTSTNYQIFPGDRLYIADHQGQEANSAQRHWFSAGPGWEDLNRVLSSRGVWLGSYNHNAAHYQKILAESQPGSTIVLLFALDHADKNVPAEYQDLLPKPWPEIEAPLKKGETVELSGNSRDRRTVLLAAPTVAQLVELIHKTKLLSVASGDAPESGSKRPFQARLADGPAAAPDKQPAASAQSASGDAGRAAEEQRAKQLAEEAENLHRRALADKLKAQTMQGPFTPKQVIAMLELPWQEKISDEKLNQAAASLKPVADEAVDQIMRAFNRNDQAFAYRHRAVQFLQRLNTAKARASLLDIALGRSAEGLPSMKQWASAAYLHITQDPAGVRKLLASDDSGVLGNALRALKGAAVDEELLKRLIELTAYKDKEPLAEELARFLAADVMAADPGGMFAARKVQAILFAAERVASVPRANETPKLSSSTNAEIGCFRYMRALAEMRGADEVLRAAASHATPLARELLVIARAQRGDATARKDLYRILDDPQAGLRRGWAAQGLGVVGSPDDLPLLKKLAASDPLERERNDCISPAGKNTYFPFVKRPATQCSK